MLKQESTGYAGAGAVACPADRALPPVSTGHDLTLMEALRRRASGRAFSEEPVPDQVLANLLWAANGVNRPETGRRTAPSACNWREIDVYVILADGTWLYDPINHALKGVAGGDLRSHAGVQAFVAKAPVVLAFVADLAKMKGADEDGRRFYPACDTGYASQNVYLLCAAAGLATVALISVDKPALHERLGLRPDQVVTLTQPVGFPESVRSV